MNNMKEIITKNKEKAPSKFNVRLSTNIHSSPKYINLLKKICCGRAEIRTRNYQLTADCFTIKLLAHNNWDDAPNYLKFNLHLQKTT